MCSPFPGPMSVLVMDNARIHHGPEIQALADNFGTLNNTDELHLR